MNFTETPYPGKRVRCFFFNDLNHMKKNLILSSFCALSIMIWGVSCGSDDPEPNKGKEEKPLEYQIENKFTNEVLPPATSPCFAGAYYRKAMSSSDIWQGIEGTVVLPTIEFDKDRVNPAKPQQYLDNPSIYMGGTSGGQETDIGMTWEVIRDENGNVSADRRAFRPFLRRSKHTASGQAALYVNAPAQKEYYWYPGETITMSVQVVDNGKLRFKVSGNGKTYETEFESAGYGLKTPAVYKRVNAIDQVSNEGKPAQPTKTKVKGAKWLSVYLLRPCQKEIVKAPMHTGRFTDMRCPDVKYFTVTPHEKSSESIVIDGGK